MVLSLAIAWVNSAAAQGHSVVDWLSIDDQAYPDLPVIEGRGGAFTGAHQGAVIVAGGSTFDRPGWEGGTKQYHREIFVLAVGSDGSPAWRRAGELPEARAHGAAVSTPQGLLCLGGENENGIRDDVLLIRYDPLACQCR